MKNLISIISKFIGAVINEFFILTGLFLIIYATYRVSELAAIYLLGAIFILFGLFLAVTRRE